MKLKLFSILVLALGTFTATGADAPKISDVKPLISRLHHVTVLVRNYDEALNWYTNKLGFAKVEDQTFGAGERWLVVAPPGQKDLGIVLAMPGKGYQTPETKKYQERIGKESLWVFETDDCERAYKVLIARGVTFTKTPQKLAWGTQAIFQDLYGNEFVLLGPPK